MPEARHFVALNEVNTLRVAPAGAGAMELLLVDDVFAPGHESLTIAYTVNGPVAAARLEITSAAHGADPLAVMHLQPSDLAPGSRYTVAWDGKVTSTHGELAGNFVNPLFAPYEVAITFDAGAGEETTPARSFSVAYHSIELRRGPWTYDVALTTSTPEPHEPESVRDRRLRLRLNEAGFWAGPVEEDLDGGLLNALRRFCSHHPFLVKPAFLDHPTIIERHVEVEILGHSVKRTAFEDAAFADPAAESRILVEELFKERGDRGELRAVIERRRLTRPAIPVEALIKLRSKSGEGVDVPASVGPVRLEFRIDEVGEDVSRLPLTPSHEFPSFARRYVQKVHDISDTADRKNCPVEHGGISEPDGSWKTSVVLGRPIPPFEVDVDSTRRVVWCNAAAFDPEYPAAHGRAGFLFRPSWIGGDGYRITAQLDFSDRPNAAELADLHGRLLRSTGTFRIWREVPLATRIAWPGARIDRRAWLDRAPKELAFAFVDLHGPTLELSIRDVLDEDSYRAAIRSHAVVPIESFAIDERAVYGAPFPEQTTRPHAYEEIVKHQIEPIFKDNLPDLAWQIRRLAHARGLGYGIRVVDYDHHVPLVVYADPPDDMEVDNPEKRLMPTLSFAAENGVAFMDITSNLEDAATHEVGHELLLNHARILSERPEDQRLADVRPEEHDALEDSCIMSSGDFPGRHFCGKCLLNLRGWILDGLPAASG